MRRLTVLLVILTLGACSEPLIPDNTCGAAEEPSAILSTMSPTEDAPPISVEDEVTFSMIDALRRTTVDQTSFEAAEPSMVPLGRAQGVEVFRLSLLAITTGGQYGAFSSGVLKGWTDNGRPDFTVVTGASAGGIVAPVAFVGTDFDDRLVLNSGIEERDVVRRRLFSGILGSSAVYSTEPLEGLLRNAYDKALIGAIRERTDTGALLLIGATNLDDGTFVRFDLAEMVNNPDLTEDDKVDCLVSAVLATSAIPALFPPRRIGGALFVDAGVRQHVFLRGVRRAIASEEANARAKGRPIRIEVDAYLLINSSLTVRKVKTPTRLLGIAGRSAEIVSDEGLRQSVLRAVDVARSEGWRLRGLIAPEITAEDCPELNGVGQKNAPLFSACVTNALFAEGVRLGSSKPVEWLGPDALVEAVEEGRFAQ
jgi:predicted acylesterase/phospholipase RssA